MVSDGDLPPCWNYWTTADYDWTSGEERLQEEDFHQGEGNGVPDMVAWAARRSWTEVQATALTFGKDPDEVDRDSVDPDIPFSMYFRTVLNRINRAQEAGQLPDPIPPKTYVRWANENGIDVPPGLVAEVLDRAWIAKLLEDIAKLPRALTRMRMERDKLRRENERLQAELQELKQKLTARSTKPMPRRQDAKGAISALWPDGVPSRAELPNSELVKQVAEKMKAMGLELPTKSDISKTIKRAAGRLR